jgi:hypothetical protein
MGHSSIETTAGYRHPAIEAATNPLDDILGAPREASSDAGKNDVTA